MRGLALSIACLHNMDTAGGEGRGAGTVLNHTLTKGQKQAYHGR